MSQSLATGDAYASVIADESSPQRTLWDVGHTQWVYPLSVLDAARAVIRLAVIPRTFVLICD
jgi:hypothetical protein